MLVALSLTACGGGGGGGGGGGSTPPPGSTNGAPTVSTTTFNATEDTDLAATLAATDPDNDTVTFAKTGDPAHGQIVALQGSGAFTYRPAAGYSGTDSFTITASDPTHQVAATISITVAAVNDAPIGANDVVSVTGTTALIDVLANDVDPENGALTISIDEAPTTGTATVVDGKVQLVVPGGFKGLTRFKYHATDAGALSSGSVGVAAFVDTAPVRLVYQTDEGNAAQNLYVDDLTGSPIRVSALTSTTTNFFGRSNVSLNGKSIVWEEAIGDRDTSSVGYLAQNIWTIPTDLSSAPRQISAPLQANEQLGVLSNISADGRYVVYGLTSAGGVTTLYVANLLPGGTSVPIALPAGALRNERTGIVFGPSSAFVYFTATFDTGGGTFGQATYRISVADPATPVRLSTAAVANREVAIKLVSPSDLQAVQISRDSATLVYGIQTVDLANPGVERTISHTLVTGESVPRIAANTALTRVAYIVDTVTHDFDLYLANPDTPASGTLVGTIPSAAADPAPLIQAVSAAGDAALISTLFTTTSEQMFEVQLTAGGSAQNISLNPRGRNSYSYIDNSTSIVFTSTPGIAVAPRGNPAGATQLFNKVTALYEFSADNQMFAAITDPLESASPLHLFFVNRGATSTPLQITGVSQPTSVTLSVRVVPAN